LFIPHHQYIAVYILNATFLQRDTRYVSLTGRRGSADAPKQTTQDNAASLPRVDDWRPPLFAMNYRTSPTRRCRILRRSPPAVDARRQAVLAELPPRDAA